MAQVDGVFPTAIRPNDLLLHCLSCEAFQIVFLATSLVIPLLLSGVTCNGSRAFSSTK